MSQSILEQLNSLIQTNPLEKKVLLTDRFAVGNQWVEQLGRMNQGSVLNLHVQTPQTFILEQSRLTLFEQGLTYTTSEESFWIIHFLMHELARVEGAYLTASMLSFGIVRCFHTAIGEMRQAGLRADQLEPAASFENKQKGSYVQALLTRYERYLQEHAWVDDADLQRYVHPMRLPSMIIIEEQADLTPAQLAALDILTQSKLYFLREKGSPRMSVIGLPTEKASFFHALGPVAEVREMFRRMAEQRVSYDEVEIIASDYRTYAPIIHSFAMNASIPCTFSQGLPMIYSRVGRATVLYLDWLESGYPLDPMLRACKQGLFSIASKGKDRQSVIRMLECSGIGWGRERYSLLRAQQNQGNDEQENRVREMCFTFFERLFAVLPVDRDAWTMQDLVRGWLVFLETVPVRTVHDSQVKQRLKQWEKSLRNVELPAMKGADVIRFGRAVVEAIVVGTDGTPGAGKLHVSSLQDGGQTGRSNTYLIGMDESSWTGAASQDLVLLDEERARISPLLRTSEEKAAQHLGKRNRRLGMIHGACTYSFTSFRISDNQSCNPAYELLHVFRQSRELPDTTIEELLEQLGRPVGYVQSSNPVVLDEQESWMKRLISHTGQIYQGNQQVLAVYGHLANGEKAASARADLLVGEYEGVFLPDGIPDATSVSKLEMYARCPTQFFFHEVLRVRPKEVATFDRTKWLSHTQKGTLLHAIFHRYTAQTQEHGGAHDLVRLEIIMEEELARLRQEVPSPSTPIMQKECDEIRRDVEVFWAGEKKRKAVPRYLELAVHQQEEMFQVEMSEEFILPLQAYVDRVDEVEPGKYRIVDYKTGAPRKFKEQEYFSRGTQLQHAIYAIAVEQWLRKTGADPSAEVVESSYYFPTDKGQGQEVARKQNRREETAALVSRLTESIQRGIFPPTQEASICTSCQYEAACGKQAKAMKKKREAAMNQERLSPFLEVEDYA
ncbi:hypothetical protein AN963_21045 [Brevibacillus choshinensis]|uniref:PD-(D/E)XK endonuclease-like domain-containing protein n=1 Tax=Brevibacillus choshinensis TaxID=54911 RepID=A0ABR5N0H4_BRECH|nr:PD-(D/E)XK nuclease family protein [Brevibacillus choshinensis]KQL43943.1 hypothetical protein AN963_21045 [Brevibacillus choshinensis]